MNETCKGHGSCHGCMGWCDSCGDARFHCDDPECNSHLRIEEVEKEKYEVEARLDYLREQTGIESKAIVDFEMILSYMRSPRYRMIPRGKRIDIIKQIIDS